MAENVVKSDFVSCNIFHNHEQHHSVRKYMFINLKDKPCVLQCLENVFAGPLAEAVLIMNHIWRFIIYGATSNRVNLEHVIGGSLKNWKTMFYDIF